MPRRVNTYRVDSAPVQGEDSYVQIRPLTVADHLRYREDVKQEGYDFYLHNFEVLAEHVTEWNWVDEEGRPLPQPSPSGEAFRLLTDPEIDFLARQVLRGPSEEQLKNSVPAS